MVPEEPRKLFVAFKVKVTVNSAASGWCVDSGATSHMTNDINLFSNLQKINATVFLVEKSVIPAVGIGESILVCNTSNVCQDALLHDVLYVPDLDDNLVSVRK